MFYWCINKFIGYYVLIIGIDFKNIIFFSDNVKFNLLYLQIQKSKFDICNFWFVNYFKEFFFMIFIKFGYDCWQNR